MNYIEHFYLKRFLYQTCSFLSHPTRRSYTISNGQPSALAVADYGITRSCFWNRASLSFFPLCFPLCLPPGGSGAEAMQQGWGGREQERLDLSRGKSRKTWKQTQNVSYPILVAGPYGKRQYFSPLGAWAARNAHVVRGHCDSLHWKCIL